MGHILDIVLEPDYYRGVPVVGNDLNTSDFNY
jgi:hypothetical protein